MRTRSSVVHSLAVVLALPAVFAPLTPLPALAKGGGETPVLALVGVHVIPMDEDRVLENQTVIVEDGNIRRVGAASGVAVAGRWYDKGALEAWRAWRIGSRVGANPWGLGERAEPRSPPACSPLWGLTAQGLVLNNPAMS